MQNKFASVPVIHTAKKTVALRNVIISILQLWFYMFQRVLGWFGLSSSTPPALEDNRSQPTLHAPGPPQMPFNWQGYPPPYPGFYPPTNMPMHRNSGASHDNPIYSPASEGIWCIQHLPSTLIESSRNVQYVARTRDAQELYVFILATDERCATYPSCSFRSTWSYIKS